jgi:hypothetical protein
MTIHEIKARHLSLIPNSHFFDRYALRSFSVEYIGDNKYRLTAAMYATSNGKRTYMGIGTHIFDYVTGQIGGKPINN